MRRRTRAGFTLLELLIAMGIFVSLGASLMLILRGGLATWRKAEARRQSYDMAQVILRQLREDLTSTLAPEDAPTGNTAPVHFRFLCDQDPDTGYQRLFFVRTVQAESQRPLTGLAGTSVLADGVIDYRGDLAEARLDALRATGGSMEVAWVLGPKGTLYRGIRTPIGPPASLFAAVDAYELAELPGEALDDTGRAEVSEDEAGELDQELGELPEWGAPALLRPYATDVIYLEYRFWTQHTTTWTPTVPCVIPERENEESGPLLFWDSTRGMLQLEEAEQDNAFELFVGRGSVDDPRDDVFPAKVRIELVVEEGLAAGTTTFLTAPLDEDAEEFSVQDPDLLEPEGGYVRIDGEWIRYETVSGNGLVTVARGGARGAGDAAGGT